MDKLMMMMFWKVVGALFGEGGNEVLEGRWGFWKDKVAVRCWRVIRALGWESGGKVS